MKITIAFFTFLLANCTSITYQGKYANITGTPGGPVTITPKYAIAAAKGN